MSTGSFKSPKIGNGDDEEESTEMEVVAANEDLLIQILLFLPPNSLLRFKSVSKAWLSLISSSRFRLLKSKRFRKDISGLISRRPRSRHGVYDFFPLEEGRNPPFERLDFVDGERDGLIVLQSCNGLLLCESAAVLERKYYVINPTTKEYTMFSGNDSAGTNVDLRQVNLAFDPRKSIHFKLICGYVSNDPETYDAEIRIYSSETGLMTRIGDTSKHAFIHGVYWNDAINWIDALQDGSYFNVSEERFGILPMPPLPHIEGWNERVMGRWIRYYGESNDHLYLICTESAPITQFRVYEMDRGYSGWSLRFCVDVRPVFMSFPQAAGNRHSYYPYNLAEYNRHCHSYDDRYHFEILGVVDRDDDAGPFLVLAIPGKAIRLNLKDKSFSDMCDYATAFLSAVVYRCSSVQFIESLHPL